MRSSPLKNAKERIRPQGFLSPAEYLGALYSAARQEDPRFSWTRMAATLGFAPTNIVYQLASGRRSLSLKTAKKIAEHLELRGNDRLYFLELVRVSAPDKQSQGFDDRAGALKKLLELKSSSAPEAAADHMSAYLSAWYLPVVRELVRLDDFNPDPAWICERISPRIRPEQAKSALKTLKDLGLVTSDKKGKNWRVTEPTTTTGHETDAVGLLNYHAEMLKLASAALGTVAKEHRDFSAINISIAEADIPLLKSMIHAFQMQVLKLDDDAKKREAVVQVNIQMFPNSKIRTP